MSQAYGLLPEISKNLNLLTNLESQIESLANQLIQSNVQLESSQQKVYKQTVKDRKAVDEFLKNYKSIEKQIEKTDTQINILNDSDILVLQENYQYLLWTILAIGIVIVGINVLKK
jgi:protein subunit release factor A